MTTDHDPVHHPSHYTQGNIECIDAIKAQLTPEEFRGFCKGTAAAYIWRERHKGGVEDLRKAVWYLDYWNSEVGSKESKSTKQLVQFKEGDLYQWIKTGEVIRIYGIDPNGKVEYHYVGEAGKLGSFFTNPVDVLIARVRDGSLKRISTMKPNSDYPEVRVGDIWEWSASGGRKIKVWSVSPEYIAYHYLDNDEPSAIKMDDFFRHVYNKSLVLVSQGSKD